MPTQLEVQNTTNSPVKVYVTLGVTPGCVQNVKQVQIANGISMVVTDEKRFLQGYFILEKQQSTPVGAPGAQGFNGNFSFNAPPMNCPTNEFPHGVNLAEVIINNGFQPMGQETIDNSCVAGANALIEFDLSADDWTSNFGAIKVKNIKNNSWNNNTGIPGVFPYSCDNCTSSDSPPDCVGRHNEYANKEPICNVQRPANNNQGGLITIKFNGVC